MGKMITLKRMKLNSLTKTPQVGPVAWCVDVT